MASYLDPSDLPILDLGLIQRVKIDGLVNRVRIVGDDFVRTFYGITSPDGSSDLVRAPILELRQAVRLYVPNYLNSLLLEEQRRLARGRRPTSGTVRVKH